MANSKNTIQNIPLEAPLCMNQLRTEVKQFQGYNEKNTTVYGGTLSPIYDKTTSLFDKDNSYTFFNSKGVPYTLVREEGEIHLYKENNKINGLSGKYVTNVEKINLRIDPFNSSSEFPTKAVAKMINGDLVEIDNGLFVYINGEIKAFLSTYAGEMTFAQVWADPNNHNCFFVARVTYASPLLTCCIFYITDEPDTSRPEFRRVISSPDCVSRLSSNSAPNLSPLVTGPGTFCFVQCTGKISGVITSYTINFDYSTNTFSGWTEKFNRFYIENADRSATDEIELQGTPAQSESARSRQEIQQTCCRTIWTGDSGNGILRANQNSVYGTVPLDSKGFVSCPIGNLKKGDFSTLNFKTYFQDDQLISIGHLGTPIDECLMYGQNSFYYEVVKNSENDSLTNITYQKSNGGWYNYSARPVYEIEDGIVDFLKKMVLDGRYVILKTTMNNNEHGLIRIYDVEEDRVRPERQIDWIMSFPPGFNDESESSGVSGVVYGAGVNAGYMINNSPFVGYLPNPFVDLGFSNNPRNLVLPYAERSDDCIQIYYTVGDTTQSATYKGKDSQYYGTFYPIDPNGNVVLPISQNAELIKGYSNNDMVKEGSTVYPLMYWNNNQRVYAYYLLAGIENITKVFSLQGQQYAVDDENIYMVAFNGGVVSQVQPVSYKKNLTFLGTLPTQAIFWSDFNKTFYAFTGDRILSKMFEASDINKIYFVGQNPSSLSLWICTDTGVYVLSDSDMFKLDFKSKQVAFQPKEALIVTEGETNNECHAINLYLDEGEEGEMVPVKLQTAYYGLGNEMKAVMDCWYLRLFDAKRTEGYVKVKVNTITDVTRHTEEKTFKVNPSDYDENNIFYIRYQPKYQECVAMQLELETNLGIYSMALGVNTTDSTAQVSKFNF